MRGIQPYAKSRVWLTPAERIRDVKARSARMLDLSMNSIRWERQADLLEIFEAVGYAEGEKKPLFDLVGHGKAYLDCGKVKSKGCDHVKDHENGKVFGRYYKRSCRRKQCPICHEAWASAEAERALIRLATFVNGSEVIDKVLLGFRREMLKNPMPRVYFHRALVSELENRLSSSHPRVVHFMLSPPQDVEVSSTSDFQHLKDRAYEIAKERGIRGGAMIFHPYRLKCSECGSTIDDYQKECPNCEKKSFEWFWGPHFHVVGFGWLDTVEIVDGYERDGWVVKGLGVRDSVFATFQYLLSHAGMSIFHTTTWFGKLAYNVMHEVPKLGAVLEVCPYCFRILRPMIWTHEDRGPPVHVFSEDNPLLNEFEGEATDWRCLHG